ncbi:MAG: DinB family protein [Mucilaginibacter sp.]|nr:DinB family protein [Mucilaginibacter sp.]
MKTIRVMIIILSLIAYKSNAQTQLTSAERDYALESLNETEAGVFSAVKNLNEAQLKFKPAADKWSIEECIKHIATAEKTLWAMVDESLKKPANPEKRSEIKFSDADLVKAVEDRSHKSKTFAALEPANSNYPNAADALADFKQNREKLIAFVKNTQDDLRNHVSVLPIGTYDAYQFILLISAHSNRHTQQIDEIMANPGFPKK